MYFTVDFYLTTGSELTRMEKASNINGKYMYLLSINLCNQAEVKIYLY